MLTPPVNQDASEINLEGIGAVLSRLVLKVWRLWLWVEIAAAG